MKNTNLFSNMTYLPQEKYFLWIRLLVEVHKSSDDIIETIRKTGQIRRSTRSIQESVSVEKDKKVEVKLAKLKSDLEHIKIENAKLSKK